MITFFVIALSFGTGVAAAAAFFVTRDKGERETKAALERAVIRAAIVCGGRITALDVRPPRDLALAEVEEQLRKMHADGYCDHDLTSDGQAMYVFREYDDAPMRALRLESLILQMARLRDGRVDASRVASGSEFSYDEVRHMLDDMSLKGLCEATERADTYRFFA